MKIDPKDYGEKNLKKQRARNWYLLRVLSGHRRKKYRVLGRAQPRARLPGFESRHYLL